MTKHDHILKDNDNRHLCRARAKSKRPIRNSNCADLADQLNSLQKAFAQERGEWERFREEVRYHLRIRSGSQSQGGYY